jgi:hypothetical protein
MYIAFLAYLLYVALDQRLRRDARTDRALLEASPRCRPTQRWVDITLLFGCRGARSACGPSVSDLVLPPDLGIVENHNLDPRQDRAA